jgi:hypothetical protein
MGIRVPELRKLPDLWNGGAAVRLLALVSAELWYNL